MARMVRKRGMPETLRERTLERLLVRFRASTPERPRVTMLESQLLEGRSRVHRTQCQCHHHPYYYHSLALLGQCGPHTIYHCQAGTSRRHQRQRWICNQIHKIPFPSVPPVDILPFEVRRRHPTFPGTRRHRACRIPCTKRWWDASRNRRRRLRRDTCTIPDAARRDYSRRRNPPRVVRDSSLFHHPRVEIQCAPDTIDGWLFQSIQTSPWSPLGWHRPNRCRKSFHCTPTCRANTLVGIRRPHTTSGWIDNRARATNRPPCPYRPSCQTRDSSTCKWHCEGRHCPSHLQ
mmetsp:Transcript_19438/g.53470  ORF Transcript_19438/g.53470 Transcript_19438/m.53470 type:complete len:290 (+) Transcript_19438:654-1523(+)